MTWTAPLTWVGNQVLTAAQMNTQLRDNLKELSPHKATKMSSFFVGTGANALVERHCKSARSALSSNTTSTSYTNLGDVGPSVTVDHDLHCIVIIAAKTANTVVDEACVMSWATTGSNVIAASDSWSLMHEGMFSNNDMSGCSIYRTNNLNVGTTTFTAKYRTSTGGNAFFDSRFICVLPL